MFSRRPPLPIAGRLGPGADQRVAGAHQHGPGPHHGLRHLDDPDLPAADRHLQHGRFSWIDRPALGSARLLRRLGILPYRPSDHASPLCAKRVRGPAATGMP